MTNNNQIEQGKKNLIVDLAFQFSLDIVKYTEQLEGLKKYNLSNQLFRSGTSVGANINELLKQIESIIKVLSKIISSTKN